MEEERRRPQRPVGRRPGEERLQALPRHVVHLPRPGVELQRERVAAHLVEDIVERVADARPLPRPEDRSDPRLPQKRVPRDVRRRVLRERGERVAPWQGRRAMALRPRERAGAVATLGPPRRAALGGPEGGMRGPP